MQPNVTVLQKPISNVWLGSFLIAAGLVAAAKKLDYGVPSWLASWPAAIIAGGLLLGIYHRFRTVFWMIPVFWGAYLMAMQQMPSLNLSKYVGAASFILAGVILIAVRSNRSGFSKKQSLIGPVKKESFVTANSFLCNTKRYVKSQDFKGADATSILGNTLIDLREANIQDTAYIDVTAVLGNTKILIPENWVMRNNITAVLGDVRHKNIRNSPVVEDGKVIVLDGTAILGNIAIISC